MFVAIFNWSIIRLPGPRGVFQVFWKPRGQLPRIPDGKWNATRDVWWKPSVRQTRLAGKSPKWRLPCGNISSFNMVDFSKVIFQPRLRKPEGTFGDRINGPTIQLMWHSFTLVNWLVIQPLGVAKSSDLEKIWGYQYEKDLKQIPAVFFGYDWGI